MLVSASKTAICFADHIEGFGTSLFRKACELDLEGVVAMAISRPQGMATCRTMTGDCFLPAGARNRDRRRDPL